MRTKVAIFASGAGSNARQIIQYFKGHSLIAIDMVVCNRKEAGVKQVAKEAGIAFYHCPRDQFEQPNELIEKLKAASIQWIVLAGFLLKVPQAIIHHYEGRIFNIHPALLPKFGGKGMYGMHVHQAVLTAKEQESGISIHLVNEHYDEGAILFQAKLRIAEGETAKSLATRIHELEHEHYSKVIEKFVLKNENGTFAVPTN